MKVNTKLTLAFLCVTVISASPAAFILWRGFNLPYQPEPAPNYSSNQGQESPKQPGSSAGAGTNAATRTIHIQMAAAWVGAFIVALWMGQAFSKLLTRPIHRLGKAVSALASGDFSYRVKESGKDEYAMLGTAFNAMVERLQRVGDALKQSKQKMQKKVQNGAEELEEVYNRLRQTQFELVQHEKMSMLGQLAAGVAHEVNTPTGAILNASVDANQHLRELVTLATQPGAVPSEAEGWLGEMFAALFSKNPARSEVDLRRDRRQVEKQFQERGYLHSRRMAEVTVAYGKTSSVHDVKFLEHLSHGALLAVLEHVLALKVSADISETSARRIARIVRSLRIYAHNSKGELADVDVNDSIDNTLLIMQSRLKQIARVETHYADNLPLIQCGPDLLQVWTNIIGNASDAIETSSHGEPGLIEITTEVNDGWIHIKISNEGPPIPQEHMQKIFEPFFTTKTIGKGTGLGLSLCVNILKQYGATITAVNEPGRVTFEVQFPTKTVKPAHPESDERKLPNLVTVPEIPMIRQV